MSNYNTALRGYAAKRIEEIDAADILIGIPCFNNEKTIPHVIQMVSHGLFNHYKDRHSVILIADGGSTDDTREVSKEFQVKPWQEKMVTIYRGPGGKGTALRSIFEAAIRLNVKACAVVDADLRSITSDWLKYLLNPILEDEYQFVSPIYMRHKFDGTITNNIVYNLTRCLYGKRVRQPIGGDFAFSASLARFYADQAVWETDIARFGIDIWMTTTAINSGFKICQSNLGVKIHDAKDPAAQLGPMFRQVIGTLFNLMEIYEENWRTVTGSQAVETFGLTESFEPEPVSVNLEAMVELFKLGYQQFGVLWKQIFSPECFREIKKAADTPADEFSFPMQSWVKILFELAATFHAWPHNRIKLIDLMVPLYYARVASFVNQARDMDSQAAEALLEEQACLFEAQKPYLIEVWDRKYAERQNA